MTLVVFPEGGQPSTSGHQCRTGGNRMPSAGSSSKPEMYSRAVQTGFPHPADNNNLQQQHQLSICICGQAAEGNCWCESLGFLKDLESCRVVLQKGCPRSRFAVLLSMHEEFCKTARGDAIINTRRRGSAHGDIRVRRSKAAPPPTLPRPRAQSVIVQNTRAAKRLNEANAQRSPQVSVKPKISVDPTRQEKPEGKGKSAAKVLLKKDQQCMKDKKCLENNALSNGTASKESSSTDEGSHLDQTSYVSQAWLLFAGCEKGKKTKDLQKLKPDAKSDPNKKSLEPCTSAVADTEKSNKQAAHLRASSQGNQKKDVESRITGLSVSSKRISKRKCESNKMPVESSNEGVKERKSDSVAKPVECVGKVAQRLVHPNCNDECDRTALLDSVTISSHEAETSISGACRLDPQDDIKDKESSSALCFVSSNPEESRLLSTGSKRKMLEPSSDLAVRELNERLKDDQNLDGSLAISVKRGERVSCRDSGIGDEVSVCELRLSNPHRAIVEDDAESGVDVTTAEATIYHKQDSLLVYSSQPLVPKEDECNIPSVRTSNSQTPGSLPLDTTKGSRCSDSTLQAEDDSLLGACAIVKGDQSVCNEFDSPLPAQQEEHGTITSSSEDKAVQGVCEVSVLKTEISPFVSSVSVVESKDSQSEHCLSPPDCNLCQDEASVQVSQQRANVSLHVLKFQVDIRAKQDDLEKMKDKKVVRKDGKIVRSKVCKKSEKEQAKERKHQRMMNPRKVGMLKFLICQSPLILSELNESDFEDSDCESEDMSWNQEDRFATLPVEIVLRIFRELGTRDLAQLKCTCKNFEWLIKRYNIVGIDSKWVEMDSYRNDPCMQCGKVRDRRGDVSLCYWHPKYYYGTGTGRHHWTCCLNTNREAPGCLEGLHDNNWTTSKVMKRSIPRQWSCNMWHLCPHKDV